MDNRIFNVNGKTPEMLKNTLRLVFEQQDRFGCVGWQYSKTHGLILCWYVNEDINSFPCPLTADEVFAVVERWLKSDQAKEVELTGWDRDADHDGSNGSGWRVYCEDWGHVDGFHGAICAVKPVYLWYGK